MTVYSITLSVFINHVTTMEELDKLDEMEFFMLDKQSQLLCDLITRRSSVKRMILGQEHKVKTVQHDISVLVSWVRYLAVSHRTAKLQGDLEMKDMVRTQQERWEYLLGVSLQRETGCCNVLDIMNSQLTELEQQIRDEIALWDFRHQ